MCSEEEVYKLVVEKGKGDENIKNGSKDSFPVLSSDP